MPKFRYEQIVRNFAQRTVAIFGNFMIDEYNYGTTCSISPEGSVMVVGVETEDFKPVGAANVINNMLAFGARVYASGIIGNDEDGRLLTADLAARGADISGIIVDASRLTTRKSRVFAQHQHAHRVDREQTHPINDKTCAQIKKWFASIVRSAELFLVSDYRKGALTSQLASHLVGATQRHGIPLIANPKSISARWLQRANLISLESQRDRGFNRSAVAG